MSCQHLRTFNLFSAYVLSAMRKGFGGHEEIQTE
jgi:6-phosphogluconate dehydrogenase (decarboxylating)